MVCDDTNCSTGNCCGNRLLQHYQLDLVSTRVGLGVVCGSAIAKDAFIVEYVGEVLLGPAALTRSNRRFQVEMKAKASWNGPTAVYIDAAECGNESRFINHSCRPNCELSELEWTNTSRLAIFAKTDIPPLRELTFRYSEGNQSQFMCQCQICSAIRE
ncbi:hypothetical protein PHYSODRAFT_529417 [Phytophthora sojae]|uniref:SET domain-containing protein n=1 Tax=Phytophthora sojae (strain P6497) TaxID=1094619 RepID=G5AAX8_PHYSP|nr:hypothetical protein PHYSODRAFT_529417 [Phytophthora sojae]EGZ07757.1 hypothetical protein PHYSODRAFT_529417 [Phytophthora sojae]|eukprot:XP_009537323.1 hypothetical protein PHYSODRAFT_529417 [Phytophthora sojae]